VVGVVVPHSSQRGRGLTAQNPHGLATCGERGAWLEDAKRECLQHIGGGTLTQPTSRMDGSVGLSGTRAGQWSRYCLVSIEVAPIQFEVMILWRGHLVDGGPKEVSPHHSTILLFHLAFVLCHL